MNELFEIEPTVPKWRELANLHGITTKDWELDESLCSWEAQIEFFGTVQRAWGDTEKEAIQHLMHKMNLGEATPE